MKQQIMYLMSGSGQLPYLVVSLFTLRQHWSGPISVFAWPDSFPIVKQILEDNRLAIDCYKRTPLLHGKRKKFQFFDKIALVQQLEDDVVLYLDADTSIHGNLDPLFEAAGEYGFAATQWNDWNSGGRIISKRIRRLEQFDEIDQEMVAKTIVGRYPSVNGGVWATRPGSPVLPLWYVWSVAAKSIFIPDETVLHIMQPKFVPFRRMTTVCEHGKYNSSPHLKSRLLRHEDVVVYHYHGSSNVRPNKGKGRGVELWWPYYQMVLENNIGGIRDWKSGIKNKWIKKLEETK